MKWTPRILLAFFITFFAPMVLGEEVIINTISDLEQIKIDEDDILLVNPDIGTEVHKISSEKEISRKVAKFFADKRALGIRHLPDIGFFHIFEVDPEAESLSLREKLGRLRGIKSNLIKLLTRQKLFTFYHKDH